MLMRSKDYEELCIAMHEICDISVFRRSFVSQLVEKRMLQCQKNCSSAYVDFLMSDDDEKRGFADDIYNHHSVFFRNPLTFSLLEDLVLPDLFQKLKSAKCEIRVWSAGCAGGHEVYSMAILLYELFQSHEPRPGYRIFASDFSNSALDEAKKGCYNEEVLSNVSMGRFKRFFYETKNGYCVLDDLKRNVSYSRFDLLKNDSVAPPDSIYGDFDIIFCANLLFYFHVDAVHLILSRLKKSIKPDGYLITGEVERQIVISNGFVEIYPGIPVFQLRKNA